MATKFCQDRILELLESVLEPLSTKTIADKLPNDSRHNVAQCLHKMHLDNDVLCSTGGGRGRPLYWWVEPPLVIPVYEDDTEEDRRVFKDIDRVLALARRGWEQRK